MRIFASLLLLVHSILSLGKSVVYDTQEDNLSELLSKKNCKIVLRYSHVSDDTIRIAENCELNFVGGSISGHIIFNNTKLSGNVNLIGSSISGKLKNKLFVASWLCYRDGEHDDSDNINSIIKICDNVFFPRGTYKLATEFKPEDNLERQYLGSVKAHIGISRDKLSIFGEDGTIFYTNMQQSILCVYSMPYAIENGVQGISIKNIEFVTENDGNTFLEWTHAIKVIGVNGLEISNCVISDFWGDAISLSHYGDNPQTGERTRNQNVRICNNVISGGSFNNRNAISVINGKNILVTNNTIKNVSQDKMPGGIDIEPNNSAYTIEDITVENNYLENIRGGGGAISLVLKRNATAKNIYIRDNRIVKSRRGIRIWVDNDERADNVQIEDNETDEHTIPYLFVGKGLICDFVIRDNVFNRPYKQDIPGDIRARNFIIKNNKKKVI